jgi:hypothetical protein
LIEACVNLGGSILDNFNADGSERDDDRDKDRKDEEQFSEDLEEFFEAVRCTRFEDEVQVSWFN